MDAKKPMHYLMRGDLLLDSIEVLKGPSETSLHEESKQLNEEHYAQCFREKFGKEPKGGHYVKKRYIWWNNQVQ